MKRTMKRIACGFFLAAVTAATATAAECLSPLDMALADHGKSLWIAEHTGKRLDQFDPEVRKVVRSIPLPDRPRGLTCSADGKTALVVTGEGEGTLEVLDLESGKMLGKIPVGHGPTAPVLAPDGKTLYVCNRFDNTVGVVDLASNKQVAAVAVVREPVAATLTPDGSRLFVANHLPDGPANVDYVAARVSVIDTASRKVVKNIQLVNGSVGLRGIQVSADGKYVFATHLMARFQVPTTQIERGWISTNALSIIRVSDLTLLYTVLLDDLDRGFANPWGLAISPDSKLLCVSSAGNHELSLIDLPALTAKVDAAVQAMGKDADAAHLNAHNDLTMLIGVRQRVALHGLGPRTVVMHGNRIYVAEYFSDSLGQVTLQDGKVQAVESIPLGPELPLTPERRGELLFNDARGCFQNWLSCASCHPDARTDGLNWDLPNDGLGNPKNVKSLLMAHQTPPTTWLGIRADAEVSVRSGFRHILFAVPPEADALAVDAYLKSLTQTPSPWLVEGKLSMAASRGEKTFKSIGCADCHPAPLYTDLGQYNVGTGSGPDAGKSFDVPSLREVWRTAPYLHDGRAATIRDVLRNKGHRWIFNKTSALSEKQLQELEAFLLSI